MDLADYFDALERDGELLLSAAERAGLDAKVPSCPEWTVRDLVLHLGNVHRMAEGVVRTGHRPVPVDADEVEDAGLRGWFTEGHARLLAALREAPADLDRFTFYPTASARDFWVRRQTHETAVHRVDAELAAGAIPTPVPAALAADGVDELLAGLHTRGTSEVRSERRRVLRVRATDVPDAVWTTVISQDVPAVRRDAEGPCDCELTGSAWSLYLALWNRQPAAGGEPAVTGDASVAELWRATSAVNQRPRRTR